MHNRSLARVFGTDGIALAALLATGILAGFGGSGLTPVSFAAAAPGMIHSDSPSSGASERQTTVGRTGARLPETPAAVASKAILPDTSGPLALQFVPVTPCRIADTRNTPGPFGGPELGAGSSREFDIPQSACGIPSTAVAYSLNVTVVPNGQLGYLTLWPSGQAQPNVSTLNSDGRLKANAAIMPAGVNGGVSIFVTDATQVILDIDGYFVPAGTSSALAFYPLTPCRVADTRQASGPLGGPSLAASGSRAFPVQASACNVPATAQAYSLNVTAIPHKALDYLTSWPTGEAQPNVSTLNSSTGAVTANAAIVPAGSGGEVSIFVSDAADVILDINGYFAPPATGGLSLFPVTPCRVIDTRNGAGPFNGVFQVGVETSACAPSASAQAYVFNATVVPPGPLNYLTLWPAGEAQPNVSTLNANDGAIASNMAIVPTNNGSIDAFSSNATNLILDISSYFAPSATGPLQTATPVFSPASGTYEGTQMVTITDATAGAQIYYTTNGNPPTTSSTLYSGAISVSASETLEAIALAPNDSQSATAMASYTIAAPLAFATTSLPNATAGTGYTQSIATSGGIGPYTFSVTSGTIPSWITASPLSPSTSTNGNLSLTGTPATANVGGPFTFTLQATDAKGVKVSQQFSITVNSATAGSTVSGKITLNNCNSTTVPAISLALVSAGTTIATTTAGTDGSYSFSNVQNGSYEITPSISGPEQVYYPAVQHFTVSGPTTGINFNAALGYTVSGTVTYAGAATGQTYIAIYNTRCGDYVTPGTSIAANGAFTIHGVQPGSYVLQAWKDNLGTGKENASNPTGSVLETVSNASLTGVSVTLVDPAPVAVTSAPVIQGVSPYSGGAVFSYQAVTNSDGIEAAKSYTLAWSTSPTFATTAGSINIPATGANGSNIWIASGLTNGTAYYFWARGVAGSSIGPWSAIYGPVTVNAPSAPNTITGAVTFTGTATGPLYTGFYNLKTGAVYATRIANPVSPQAFTVEVPTGSDYFQFGVIDQNNDGAIDTGDITNTKNNTNNPMTVSGNATDNLTLTSASSSAVLTEHSRVINPTGQFDNYLLGFRLNTPVKLPVAVQLTSGPNVLIPVDIASCGNCGNSDFNFVEPLYSVSPSVGDSYGLLVTYSDGTSETLTATVAAVLNSFATNLAPTTGTSQSTTPTFSWTDAANASGYLYSFDLYSTTGGPIWQIPSNNSNFTGFPSSITSITWGTDPTGDTSNLPSVSSLTDGTTYDWVITAYDSNFDSASIQVSYEPGSTPADLPAPKPVPRVKR